METKQLITFITAAENLNFTKTAVMLNFAQSSVTAQIKKLEAELGTPLFERLGKRIVLTEAGHKFKLYADKMIMLDTEAKTAIAEESKSAVTLTIGAQESQCTYRLPPILKEFKKQHPNVKLVFKPAHSDEMARKQLMDGTLDLAFIMDSSKPEEALFMERLVEEKMKLVASPDHPLLFKEKITTEDLIQETLLLTELGCSYRSMLEESFRAAGVYPLNNFEFGSIEAIKQCVMAGLGISLLPAMTVEKELNSGEIKELVWSGMNTPIYTMIGWHKDKWMTRPLQSFIDLTKETFEMN
ncbi:LysR family transcriptional regulator [Cytobacillus horneckiae]|uniref:LysR family transcriptional regulator n=1 Tax=Cytobacillus horneckiae TaxID=549687 RepID=UPI003D9A41A3